LPRVRRGFEIGDACGCIRTLRTLTLLCGSTGPWLRRRLAISRVLPIVSAQPGLLGMCALGAVLPALRCSREGPFAPGRTGRSPTMKRTDRERMDRELARQVKRARIA